MSHILFLSTFVLVSLSLSGCPFPGEDSPEIENTTDPHWVAKHNPRANIAVVFVHGIFGDTVGTWTGAGTSFFNLVKDDSEIGPKVDIFAFGYTSRMLGSNSLGIDEAANLLHSRLDVAGVLEYPAIVFINHSMGGLVVLQMLYQHRDILPKVPDIVLFSTPQSGSDITRIAQHISGNEGLRNMLPGDTNAFIRVLNDNWKAIEPDVRPHVHCAYEKEKTSGILIVEWASATRFCDGSALAIVANHISIVKPDRPQHDSFMVVQRVLRPLVNKQFEAKLETPDFEVENGQTFITISNPSGRRTVRIRNGGAIKLVYSLDQWPDGLHIWPHAGEHTLEGNQTDTLEMALVWGSTSREYDFILSSDVADPRPVIVRIPTLTVFHAEQVELTDTVLSALANTLEDRRHAEGFQQVPFLVAQEKIVEIVRAAISERDPSGLEVGHWIRTAELLTAVNWPELGALALQKAERSDPSVVTVNSVRLLAGRTAGLSGRETLAGVPAISTDVLRAQRIPAHTPFTTDQTIEVASSVSAAMRRIGTLNAQGLSLEGDIARVRGEPDRAVELYREAADFDPSPSNELRVEIALEEARDQQ